MHRRAITSSGGDAQGSRSQENVGYRHIIPKYINEEFIIFLYIYIYIYSFRLGIPVKPMRNCDCEWTSDDDSRLLIGIYEYGMGSWEQVQSDISLGLMKKVTLYATMVLNYIVS